MIKEGGNMEQPAHISYEKKDRIVRAADSLLSVAILVLTFKASAQAGSDNPNSVVEYFAVYLLLAVSCLLQALRAYQTDRRSFVRNTCFSAVFAISGAAWMFLGMSVAGVVVLMEACLLVVLTNRILQAVSTHKTSVRVLNIILSVVIAVFAASTLYIDEERVAYCLVIHAILIAGRALIHIIYISFSQMRIGVLRKVIRKTFAGEIFLGLILLIVSFSFVFQAVEPGIKTYFDAIWYCFALVTTTGFGDLVVSSVLCRTLSIILGVYGIVVVAVITSVIVSFYNEVKNDANNSENDPDDQQAEE